MTELFDFDRVLPEQIESISRHAPLVLSVNAAIVAMIMASFWQSPLQLTVSIWGAVALALTGVSLLRALVERRNEVTRPAAYTARMFALMAGLRGAVWGAGMMLLMPDANSAQLLILGWTLLGMICGGCLVYWTLPPAAAAYASTFALGGAVGLAATGNPIGYYAVGALILFAGVLCGSAMSSTRILTSHARDRRVLAERNETIRLLLKEFEDGSSDWLWETDSRGVLIRGRARFAEKLGCSEEVLAGEPLAAIVAHRAAKTEQRPAAADLKSLFESGRPFREADIALRGDGGEHYWRISAKPVFDGKGSLAGWRGVASDVTAAKAASAKIDYLAHFDLLTGLPNRTSFLDRLAQAFAGIGETGSFFVFHLDIDGLKPVNDTLGHEIGDRLLGETARRLAAVLIDGDMLYRVGGDEFALVCMDAEGNLDVEKLGRVLVSEMSEPFDIEGHNLQIGVSIGIARAGDDCRTPDQIVRHADLALHRAKREGRGMARFYDPAMDRIALARREMKFDLGRAIARHELQLHFQPIFSLATNEATGYEALLRWIHPERGTISPAEFIPVAEETGLILDIGEWAVREACRQAAAWPGHIRVAVNLSPVQLKSMKFPATVVGALVDSGLRPDRLELEITESAFIDRADLAFTMLNMIKRLGVRIALDDFGTGYSSLGYLHRFGFDKIKIDRTFVQDLASRKESAAIVKAVLSLAADLGMTVTAEGIETAAQLAKLRELGCNEAQGFLLGRPAPAGRIGEARIAATA